MAQHKNKKLKRKKYSNNQIVVFRFGTRNLVGKVINAKPVGKKSFIYDIKGEDGKIYEEITVNGTMNQSIDTNYTKIFYKANGITQSHLPETEYDDSEIDISSVLKEDSILIESDSFRSHEDEVVDMTYAEMHGSDDE